MPHAHSSRSHYVRPGIDDPVYNRSGFRHERYGADDEYFSTGGWKKIRKRADEGRASAKGKGKGKGKKKAKAPGKSKTTARASLFVFGRDGETLYLCGERKAKRTKAGIIATLPRESYAIKGKTIRLTQDLRSLGFESIEELRRWCSSLAYYDGARATNMTAPTDVKARADSRERASKDLDSARTANVRKRYTRKKQWHRVEDEALRHQFAIGETEMYQIKRAIPYRTNADIKLRIQELGLNKPDTLTVDDLKEVLRQTWAVVLVNSYYAYYGSQWDRWQLILPWLDEHELSELAESLGCDSFWSDEERKSFLEREGANWTLDELNMLIRVSPMLDDENELWPLILPGISHEDRCEMQQALNIPSKNRIDELVQTVAQLDRGGS